jgi:tetratricopeptide (TPR) repeat protein
MSTIGAAIGCLLIFAVSGGAAGTNAFAARAERLFTESQQLVRREPTNVAALVQLARAAFDWGEYATKDVQRADIAERGIDAARLAIQKQATNGAAHYWLAMNLGQMARAKMLAALLLVREMETEFLQACGLDDRVDHAGPDRSLGILYREAPGWPTSIGNKQKARVHVERAVQLVPDFPENQLTLLESYVRWEDRAAAIRIGAGVEKCLAAARPRLTGEEWAASWADWEKRWKALKAAEPSLTAP